MNNHHSRSHDSFVPCGPRQLKPSEQAKMGLMGFVVAYSKRYKAYAVMHSPPGQGQAFYRVGCMFWHKRLNAMLETFHKERGDHAQDDT